MVGEVGAVKFKGLILEWIYSFTNEFRQRIFRS